MSHYTKDKNIITFTIDGANGVYKFDLSSGIFYGLKGNPVKTNPKKSAIANMFYPYRNCNQGSQLAYTLYYMFDYNHHTNRFTSYVSALSVAERLDNMGLVSQMLTNEALVEIGNNWKEFLDYLKTRTAEQVENKTFRYHDYCSYSKVAKAKKRWGANVISLFPENVFARLCDYSEIYDYTADEMTLCAYYLVRGKMFDFMGGDCRRLCEYISLCKGMNKEPQKVNNFMREYCETKAEYELRKIEYDNKRIAENYAKHRKAFEFEYGDFIIVCPTTANDLITEGRNMHHCVGGYVDQIVNGRDYIVFVRHKDKPEECYLTCEIYTDGTIGQYYLAYDRCIREKADIDFKNAFANHLKENWNN